jgi:tRNA(His) 5'-end guanylyltransferase
MLYSLIFVCHRFTALLKCGFAPWKKESSNFVRKMKVIDLDTFKEYLHARLLQNWKLERLGVYNYFKYCLAGCLQVKLD